MRNARSRAIWGVLFATLAASPAAAETLSDAEAVRIAMRSNPTLRAAVLDARRADASVAAEDARLGWVLLLDGGATHAETPQSTTGGITESRSDSVDVGAQVGRTFTLGTAVSVRADGSRRTTQFNPVATTTDTIDIGPTYDLGVELDVTQPLLRGAGTDVGTAPLRTAEAQRDAARAARDGTASQVLRDLLAAYWELWYATVALDVERSAKDLAVRQRDDARARVANGSLAAVEVLSFDARLAGLEESVAAAEVEREARALDVGRLLGIPADRAAELLTPPDAVPEAAATDRSAADVAGEATRAAIARSAELREMRAALHAARIQARVAGDTLQPRLDLVGWVRLSGLGDRDPVAPFEAVGQASSVSAHVGAELELPLSTAQRRAIVEGAALGAETAEERLRETELRIAADVRAQAARLDAARRRVALALSTVETSRALAEAERGRFAIGTATALQVLAAEDGLRAAELRVARARVDAKAAALALGHLTGSLLGTYGAESAG